MRNATLGTDLATCTADELWFCFRHKQVMTSSMTGGSDMCWLHIDSIEVGKAAHSATQFYLRTRQETSNVPQVYYWHEARPFNEVRKVER